MYKKCNYTWVNSSLSVLANPLAVLYPIYSNTEHTVNYRTARPWEAISAAKFTCGMKGQNLYIGLVNAVSGELHYIHHFAYSC